MLSEQDYARRIGTAHAEKYRTRGDILRDGLFGSGDKARSTRGKGIARKREKAQPHVKADSQSRKSGDEIHGRPHTGTVRFEY